MEWANYVAEKKWRNSVFRGNSSGRFLHGPPLKCFSSQILGVRQFLCALSIFGISRTPTNCLREVLVTWPLSASGLFSPKVDVKLTSVWINIKLCVLEVVLTVCSLIKFRNIFTYKQVVRYCNVLKEVFVWEHGNRFSSLEIPLEPEFREDQPVK